VPSSKKLVDTDRIPDGTTVLRFALGDRASPFAEFVPR
jgi:hypothetical protein